MTSIHGVYLEKLRQWKERSSQDLTLKKKKKKAISITDSSSRVPGITIIVSRSVQMKWNSPVVTQKQQEDCYLYRLLAP